MQKKRKRSIVVNCILKEYLNENKYFNKIIIYYELIYEVKFIQFNKLFLKLVINKFFSD